MKTTVFRKNQKGAEEVADRRHGLQKKLRRVLIINDAAKEMSALSELSDQLFTEGRSYRRYQGLTIAQHYRPLSSNLKRLKGFWNIRYNRSVLCKPSQFFNQTVVEKVRVREADADEPR